jgi:hypothetical protein
VYGSWTNKVNIECWAENKSCPGWNFGLQFQPIRLACTRGWKINDFPAPSPTKLSRVISEASSKMDMKAELHFLRILFVLHD